VSSLNHVHSSGTNKIIQKMDYRGMTTGIIFDIKRYAIHDGPGIRTTVFLKGCAATCWWCHNPESQSSEIEKAVRNNRLDDINYEETEIIGKKMTVQEVMAEIQKDLVFYDESGGGVTFSGGEPLLQADFLRELLLACQLSGIQNTLDTTGYAPRDVFHSIIDHVDLFLYDIKFVDDQLHQKYAGVSNTVILDNLNTLIMMKKSIRLRLPIIPNFTDGEKNIDEIAKFILKLNPGGMDIDMLPYHKIARHKYEKLNKEYLIGQTEVPSKLKMQQLKKTIEAFGHNVSIGG